MAAITPPLCQIWPRSWAGSFQTAKMRLLRGQSLGPRADDPDTFPRRGGRGGARLYAPAIRASSPGGARPASDHTPRQLLLSGAHSAGRLSGLQGRVLGLTFSLGTARGGGRQERTGDRLYRAAGVSKASLKAPQSAHGSCPLLGEDLPAPPSCQISVPSPGCIFLLLSRTGCHAGPAVPLTACLR